MPIYVNPAHFTDEEADEVLSWVNTHHYNATSPLLGENQRKEHYTERDWLLELLRRADRSVDVRFRANFWPSSDYVWAKKPEAECVGEEAVAEANQVEPVPVPDHLAQPNRLYTIVTNHKDLERVRDGIRTKCTWGKKSKILFAGYAPSSSDCHVQDYGFLVVHAVADEVHIVQGWIESAKFTGLVEDYNSFYAEPVEQNK